MSRLLFFMAILLYSLVGKGQSSFTYFNKTYGGNDTINILAQAVQPIEGGYLVLGGYGVSDHQAFYIQKLNQQGDMIWIKEFETGNVGSLEGIGVIEWGSMVFKEDNLLSVTYRKQSDVCLTKLNYDGDSIFHHQYQVPAKQTPMQIIRTSDGGYIIAGRELVATNDTVKGYALKVDSMGNFMWDKRYIMGNDARFFTVEQTPWDNGYIFGGMGYTTATGYDMWIVKTYANGDTMWTTRIGGPEFDCGALVRVLTTEQEWLNGMPIRYLVSGCLYEGGEGKMYLAVLNEAGLVVQEKEHNFLPSLGSLQIPALILPDKSFMASGYYSFPPQPYVAHFNADLSVDWFTTPTLNIEKQVYIKDLQPTPDGGYVLAGYQYSTPQTAWVFKIDSLGTTCAVPNCDSTVVIDALPVIAGSPSSSFGLSPNPCTDFATLSLAPAAAAVGQQRRVELFDISGRLVKTIVLPNFSATYTFSVTDLPNGLYYCRLSGIPGTEKLVIIH